MKSTNLPIFDSIQFGKGYYQLDYLTLETGELTLRAPLLETQQRELISLVTHPKSNAKVNPDYSVPVILLDTDFQVKDNCKDLSIRKAQLKKLTISEEYQHVVPLEMHLGINYAIVNLDEEKLAEEFAVSQEYPDKYIYVELITQDKKTLGHIVFHDQQLSVFPDYPIHIFGQENSIQALFINTMSDVLIDQPLRVIKNIHIFCHALTLSAVQQFDMPLLQASYLHFLCTDQCTTTSSAQLITDYCEIRTGTLTHKGHIESEKTTSIIAEIVEMYGSIAAKGKSGITIITLGIQTQPASHLHGSMVNMMVGNPKEDLLGKVKLEGLISCKGLNIFANDLSFADGSTYVQGSIILSIANKSALNKNAKIFFNGKLIHLRKQFASLIAGTVKETSDLKIYWKKIIDPHLSLTTEEQLCSMIPRVSVHHPIKTAITQPGLIEFLPVLAKQEDYLYKIYDETQFIPLETEIALEEEKNRNQIVLSAEYLSVPGDISLVSAQVRLQADHLQFSANFSNVSFFGSVDLSLQSDDLDLRGAVINTHSNGHVSLEAKSMKITNSYIAAEQIAIQAESLFFPNKEIVENESIETTLNAAGKITIKSEGDITISSKLILKSPATVMQCKNFYLEKKAKIEFQELSIKAERLIYVMMWAEMKGQKLDLDAKYFIAFLSSFKVNKSFSVQSIVSIIGCLIACDYYVNTSIVNLSCSLYLPATLSLSAKSMLGCFLAAANTLISILQLVLHDPTCQLALTAARLGINAGPALYQAYQLAKSVHAATKAPNLARGDLIKLANQTKTLLLSLGSLVYGGAGIAKQFAHFSQLSDMPSKTNQWQGIPSIINNLNSVATPLLSMVFLGKHTSNFLNINADITACLSSTQYGVVSFDGGVNMSPLATNISVVNGMFNPLSNLSAVLSTNTSLYSMSEQESIVPIGAHSERTMYKTYLGTGIPSLPQYISVTAHQITFIGHADQEFKNSTIQADKIFIPDDTHLVLKDSSLNVNHTIANSGKAEFYRSQVQGVVDNHGTITCSQTKVEFAEIHNDTTFLAVNSNLHVSGTFENAGLAQFGYSRVTVNDWQNDTGTTLLQQSQLEGRALLNKGVMQYVESKVEFAETHNYDKSVTLGIHSEITLPKITDDLGAITQIVASQFTSTGQWKEAGLFAGDGGSYIQGGTVSITKDAQVGSRTTSWQVEELSSEINIYLGFNGTHHPKDTPVEVHSKNTHHPKPVEPETKKFSYIDDSKLNFSLSSTCGIQYHAEGPFKLKGDLVSVLPLSVEVSGELIIKGPLNSTTSLSLTSTDHVTCNHAIVNVNGLLDVHGEVIAIQKGSEIVAQGDILLDSKTQLNSQGDEKVETHTKKNHTWFRTNEEREVKHFYRNNKVVSINGDVKVHSGEEMAWQGTDIEASNNIEVTSEGDINFIPLQGTDSASRKHTNITHCDEYKQTVDTASPSHLVAKKGITITTKANVYSLGTELSAGEVKFNLSEHSILDIRALVLNSHYEESHSGLYLSHVGGMKLPLSAGQYVAQLPLVQNTKQLTQANDFDDKLSAMINLSTETINTTHRFLSVTRNDGISAGLEQLFLPSFNLTWKLKHSTLSVADQFVGPGRILTKHLLIDAGKAQFSDNFAIESDSTDFNVNKLEITGAELQHRENFQENALVFSISPSALLHPGFSSFGVTHSDHHSSQDYWQGSAMHLGDFHWQGKEAIFYGSQIHIKNLTGNVDELIVDAAFNNASHTSDNMSFYSSGSFSFGNSEGFSSTAAIKTPFISDNNGPFDASQFSVDTLISHGEKITGIHADHNQFVPIYEVNKEHSFSISGPWREMMPGHTSGQVFSTWDVRYNHFGFTAPIYHADAGERFADNLKWLMGTKLIDQPVVTEAKHSHQNGPDLLVTTTNEMDTTGPDNIFDPLFDPVAHLDYLQSLIPVLDIDFSDTPFAPQQDPNLSSIRFGLLFGELPYSSAKNIQPFYRGDASDFDDVFNNGIKSRGNNLNLSEHAIPEGNDFLIDSGYISTSLDEKIARGFPKIPPEISHSYVYKIYSTRPTIDVAKALDPAHFESEDLEIYKLEQERVFTSEIFPHEIQGAWPVSIRKEKVIDPEALPFFTKSWPEEVINERCHEYTRTIGEEFISNPNFIFPSYVNLFSSTVKSLGHFATGVGMVLDGMDLYQEYQHSKETGNYDNTRLKGLQIGSGWSGACGMGWLGVETGVAVCAPLTPYGQAICGIGLGLIGSAMGYYGGSALATKIYDVNNAFSPQYTTITTTDSITQDTTNWEDHSVIFKTLEEILEKIIPPAFGSEPSVLDLNFDNVPLISTTISEKNDITLWPIDNIDPINTFDPLFDPVAHLDYLQSLIPILDIDFNDTPFAPQQDPHSSSILNGLQIVGGWSGACGMGWLGVETGAAVCAPLTPYGQVACGIGLGLIGSAMGYYGGSTLATRIFEPETHGLHDDHHEKLFINNFGPLVEMVKYIDVSLLEGWNHSFQHLVKSSEMEIYLSTAKQSLGQSAAFKDFVKTILDPIADSLFDRGSYIYPWYGRIDGAQFLSPEVFKQFDIFGRVEKIAENMEKSTQYCTKLMETLERFYLFGIVAENTYQFSKGESLWSLVKEDVDRTAGGIIGGVLSERLVSFFTDSTINAGNFILDALGKEKLSIVKPINSYCRLFSLPVGVIGGSLIGEYLSEQDEDSALNTSMDFVIAWEARHASVLRDALGAEFKESILPFYSAKFVSNNAIDTYFNYVDVLKHNSTPMGAALIKPIPRNIFGLSQIADKFSMQTDLPEKFVNSVKDNDLMEFAKFKQEFEFKPIYNVNGDFFREEIINKHSDFSDTYINKLNNVSKILFVTAIGASIYQVAMADDKLNEIARLGFITAITKGASYLGVLAGIEFCGAFSPLCVAGAGIAVGVAGGELAKKTWDQVLLDSHVTAGQRIYDIDGLPSLNTPVAFFKPSERLRNSLDISPSQTNAVHCPRSGFTILTQ